VDKAPGDGARRESVGATETVMSGSLVTAEDPGLACYTPNGAGQPLPPAAWEADVEVVGRVAKPRISVVIPALNEAQNLFHVLPRIPDNVWEVILVDGGSQDGTVEVFGTLRRDGLVLTHERPGKGNALAAGFAACRGDIVVMLDADGSADPAEIPKFVEALLAGADFAKGTRFAQDGGSEDITAFRGWGNRMLVGLVNLLYRVRYTDLCYGMNAFWRHCLPCITPDRDGFEVETLINVRLAKSSLKVQEVGSYERRRLHGASHLHAARDGFRVLRTILRERFSGSPAAVETTVPILEDLLA
jgi:glycosyltransferase involved in cell wall biosynthesis